MEKILEIVALIYLCIGAALYISGKFVVLSVENQKKFSAFCKHFTLCSALAIFGLFSWKQGEMGDVNWWMIGTYLLGGIFFLKRASSSLRMTFIKFLQKHRYGVFTLENVVGNDGNSLEYWGTIQVGKRYFAAQLAIGIFEKGVPQRSEIFIKFDECGALDCLLVYQAQK